MGQIPLSEGSAQFFVNCQAPWEFESMIIALEDVLVYNLLYSVPFAKPWPAIFLD
jgi:hypothetical protein